MADRGIDDLVAQFDGLCKLDDQNMGIMTFLTNGRILYDILMNPQARRALISANHIKDFACHQMLGMVYRDILNQTSRAITDEIWRAMAPQQRREARLPHGCSIREYMDLHDPKEMDAIFIDRETAQQFFNYALSRCDYRAMSCILRRAPYDYIMMSGEQYILPLEILRQVAQAGESRDYMEAIDKYFMGSMKHVCEIIEDCKKCLANSPVGMGSQCAH